jgi:K+-sensing histidine kinase KdpD
MLHALRRTPRVAWITEQARGTALALATVAAVTALIGLARLTYKFEHITILYLIPVLVAALRWGIVPAVAAALAGIAAPAYFFYAPIYDLRVQDPDQIIDLVLFVIVAVVTGQLAVRVRQARLRAEAEHLREALIGSVSHELKTPLAAIVGSTSVLARAPAVQQDDQLAGLVRAIRNESERLSGDIANLLDASRISAEGISPRWAWVDPQDIINGAIARKRHLLDAGAITRQIADDLPLVYVDASMMEAAIAQLIENAAKYSQPSPPVTVSATRETDQQQDHVVIKVTDAGQGLALGEPEKVFERFYRSPRHATTVPGSGLGLWIARALIEACGGRVRAFSLGVGQGTTLRVDLPVRPQPAPEDENE